MPEIEQSIQFRVDRQDNITAATAISAIWPAARSIFFTVKVHHPISAAARLYINFCLIKIHKLVFFVEDLSFIGFNLTALNQNGVVMNTTPIYARILNYLPNFLSKMVSRVGSPISCNSYRTRWIGLLIFIIRVRSIGVPLNTMSTSAFLIVFSRSFIILSP